MVIEKIELKNYKKIKSLLLVINGDNLAVTGAAGQGKTTVITALWELIEMVGEPVTSGAAIGSIKITLADGVKKVFAERRFTAKTKTINIIDNESNKITVGEFKSWFSSLAVNPHDLLDLTDNKLLDKLVEVVQFPEGFNLRDTEAAIASAVESRKNYTQDIKRFEADLGPEPEKVEVVDTVELLAQLEAEKEKEKTYNEVESNIEKSVHRLEAIATEIAALEAEKKKLLEWKPGAQQWLKECTVDVVGISNKINNIAADNVKAAAYQTWQNKKKLITDTEIKKADILSTLKDLKNQLKLNLEGAQWPLPGLSIADGVVYYNQIPFSQAGDSEKMLVCGALAAEQIQKNVLKVVRMDGIESMAASDFDKLQQIFNTKGIQVLSTRVNRGDTEPGELIIHDGGVL